MISIKKFDGWLNKSSRGNRIMYYRGYMCDPNLQRLTPTLDERRVRNLRNHVYSAYEHNVVTLVQKKHGDFDYEYIAMRL